jgi:hypothetical protein
MNDTSRYIIDNYDDEGAKLEPTILVNDGSLKDDFLSCGLIAQEVLLVEDELCEQQHMFVNKTNPDHLGIRYETLITPMIKAIQELTQKCNDLSTDMNFLLERIIDLENP